MNGNDDMEGQGSPEHLLVWGCGEFGQHGHGKVGDISCRDGTISQLAGRTVKAFACGSSHTVVITDDNSIFVWGNGNSGQLGTGKKTTVWDPYEIHLGRPGQDNPDIRGVACGARHTFIWLTTGHMYSFGNNFYAQLGYDFRIDNYKDNQVCPHLLQTLTYRAIQQVACGEKHSLLLCTDGTVGTIGNNNYGQIGSGTREESVVPHFHEDLPAARFIACGANHNLMVTECGEVYQWGYGKACGKKRQDVLDPKKLRLRNIVQVAGGLEHSAALSGSGNVYTWGTGLSGQLGLQEVTYAPKPCRVTHSDLEGQVVKVACGEAYTAAVTASGHLYVWGKNSHLVDPDKPESEKYFHPYQVDTGGQKVKDIRCGAWHMASVTGLPEWEKSQDNDTNSLSDEYDSEMSEPRSSEGEVKMG